MASSILRPRMSRAWPEPSTHLTASTMFVLPEPLGPTMAVTPPSNLISVCRAKVLKPVSVIERRCTVRWEVTRCGGPRPGQALNRAGGRLGGLFLALGRHRLQDRRRLVGG